MSDTPRTDAILALLPGGQSCDPQAAADDLRPEIARLEREIEDWKDKLDGSEITHEATRADLRDCKRELEQERQLADRLANALTVYRGDVLHLGHFMPAGAQVLAERTLTVWKAARNEAVDPP